MNTFLAVIMRILWLWALGVASVIGYNYMVWPENWVEIKVDIQKKSEPDIRSQYEDELKEMEEQAWAQLDQREKARQAKAQKIENIKKGRINKATPAKITELTTLCKKEFSETYVDRLNNYMEQVKAKCAQSDDLYCWSEALMSDESPSNEEGYIVSCVSGKLK